MSERFSQLPNELIEDVRISAKAFRVAAYLYSRPTGWEVKNSDIMAKISIKDEGSLAKYWKELMDTGWLTRARAKDEEGKLLGNYDYTLNVSPVQGKNPDTGGKPYKEKTPIREKPVHGKNPDHNNTDSCSNTDSSNNRESAPAKNESEKQQPISPPTPTTAPGAGPLPGGEAPLLPPDEQRIKDACERVYAHFKKYPALVDICREQAKDPTLSKKAIIEEIKAWVRYHVSEFHFLSTIEANVSKSFLAWMRNRQQFAAKPQGQRFQQQQPAAEPFKRAVPYWRQEELDKQKQAQTTPLAALLGGVAQKMRV